MKFKLFLFVVVAAAVFGVFRMNMVQAEELNYVIEDVESASLPIEVKAKLTSFPKSDGFYKEGSFIVHSGTKAYIFISAGISSNSGHCLINGVAAVGDTVDIKAAVKLNASDALGNPLQLISVEDQEGKLQKLNVTLIDETKQQQKKGWAWGDELTPTIKNFSNLKIAQPKKQPLVKTEGVKNELSVCIKSQNQGWAPIIGIATDEVFSVPVSGKYKISGLFPDAHIGFFEMLSMNQSYPASISGELLNQISEGSIVELIAGRSYYFKDPINFNNKDANVRITLQ